MRRSSVSAAWAVLLVAAALVGCSNDDEPQPQPPPQAPTTTPAADPDRWPLTGLEDTDPAARPALAVKIENSAQARPQTGLAEADIVWEEMVEGGITRFNAVYHSQLPPSVGPIRSVRPMDAAIVAPLGGPQVISGGQRLFLEDVAAAGVQLISHDGGGDGFERNPDRRAPHNLYGSPEVFVEQAESQDPPPPQLEMAATPEEATASLAGEPATAVALTFPAASPGWTWDEESGAWLRDESGEPALAASGEQLTTTNVVVLRVEIVASAGRDQSGDAVPETVLVGEGDALVASGGQVIETTWRKSSPQDPVELQSADGAPVLLAPGTTWIELVPSDRGDVTLAP